MKRFASLFCALFLVLVAVEAQAEDKEGVLIVAFGTSMESAMPSLNDIDAAYKAAYPGKPIVWAYTSDIIRKKLAKEGKKIFSVIAVVGDGALTGGMCYEALNDCAEKGITSLRVQPLHVTAGEEYMMLQRMIVKNLTKNPGKFEHVYLAYPLIYSSEDLDRVIDAVLGSLAKDRKSGDYVVLMGHGNDRGASDLTLAAIHDRFLQKDPHVFVATVEGANGFSHILPVLKSRMAKTVHIEPLMVVAGDHANNDLAGSEDDSWASQMKKAGMKVVPHLRGLGEIPAIRDIYLSHTQAAKDDMAHPKKSD